MKIMQLNFNLKGSNMRKILFYTAILSVIFSVFPAKKIYLSENESHSKHKNRNLQYALNSIYYNLAYPANNITGTGDLLKDVPFKVLCMLLACNTGCCVGEIDNMRCGLAADCQVYLDYSRIPGMVAAIVVPIGVFLLLIALFIYLYRFRKYSCCCAFCMCLGCLFVITIPFVAYYIFCRKQDSVTPEKIKENNNEDNQLLVNNRDGAANTLKNEPEVLLINNNVAQKRHQANLDRSANNQLSKEYRKLHSDDQEMHQKQLISIGHPDIYSEKMKIRIPDPTFDDNFLNEKSNNSVRVNSAHNQNGRAADETNKEPEEEYKSRSNSDRQEFLGHENHNLENENLINEDENDVNHHDLIEDDNNRINEEAEMEQQNGDEENNNNNENENIEDNNNNKIEEEPENRGEEGDVDMENGENAHEDADGEAKEEGEENNGENGNGEENNGEQEGVAAEDHGEEADNNKAQNDENNVENVAEENNEENGEIINNAEKAEGEAQNEGEIKSEENPEGENNAEVNLENLENNEEAGAEAKNDEVENKPEEDAQVENPENVAAENKEESPQE